MERERKASFSGDETLREYYHSMLKLLYFILILFYFNLFSLILFFLNFLDNKEICDHGHMICHIT